MSSIVESHADLVERATISLPWHCGEPVTVHVSCVLARALPHFVGFGCRNCGIGVNAAGGTPPLAWREAERFWLVNVPVQETPDEEGDQV